MAWIGAPPGFLSLGGTYGAKGAVEQPLGGRLFGRDLDALVKSSALLGAPVSIHGRTFIARVKAQA